MPGSGGSDQNQELVSTRVYQSGPPVSKQNGNLVDGEDVVRVTKQEEWVTKKKVDVTTTKQIETRVQRQVVLEDGEMVEDSGPLVTSNVTQDQVVQESENTENKTSGEDPPTGEGWVSIAGAVVVKEKHEKITNTHDVKQETVETEDSTNKGPISHNDLVEAIREKKDLRIMIGENEQNRESQLVPQNNKKVVHQSTKHKRIVDVEDVKEVSELKDGEVVTETSRTCQREEYNNEEMPDNSDASSSVKEEKKESGHNYSHSKNEDFVEYMAVPKGGTLAEGVKVGEGMHVVAEDIQEEHLGDRDHWNSHMKADGGKSPEKEKTTKEELMLLDRTDALTKKPLNLNEEEKTRKSETFKWLEHHFGSTSESSASRSSSDAGDNVINVTMKSKSRSKNGSEKYRRKHAASSSQSKEVSSVTPEPQSPLKSPQSPTDTSYFQGIRQWDRSGKRATGTDSHVYSSPTNNRPIYSTPRRYNSTASPLSKPWSRSTEHLTSVSPPPPPPPLHSTPVKRTASFNHSPRVFSGIDRPWQRRVEVKQSPLREEYRRIVEQMKQDKEIDIPQPKEAPPRKPERKWPPSAAQNGVEEKKVYVTTTSTRIGDRSTSPKRVTTINVNDLFHNDSSSPPVRPMRKKKPPPPLPLTVPPPLLQTVPPHSSSDAAMNRINTEQHSSRRYFLGEDPYRGGLFNQRDSPDHSQRFRGSSDDSFDRHKHYVTTRSHSELHRPQTHYSSTLGRYSSVSSPRVTARDVVVGRSQTLPRKLNTSTTSSNGSLRKFYFGDESGSFFSDHDRSMDETRIYENVQRNDASTSFRSPVSRSQSFNVTSSKSFGSPYRSPRSPLYRSNPFLDSLGENEPLKSPHLVTRTLSRLSSKNRPDDIVKRETEVSSALEQQPKETQETFKNRSYTKPVVNVVNGYSKLHSEPNVSQTKVFTRQENFDYGYSKPQTPPKPVINGHVTKTITNGHVHMTKPITNGHVHVTKPVTNGHIHVTKPTMNGQPYKTTTEINTSKSNHSEVQVNGTSPSPDSASESKRQTFLKGLLSTAPELYMHLTSDDKSPPPPPPSTPPPPLNSPTGMRPPPRSKLVTSNDNNKVRIGVPSSSPLRRAPEGRDVMTDTVQTFTKKTIPGKDGQPAATIESNEKTTITKSHYQESEVMHPKNSGLKYIDIKPQHTKSGGVIIQVRDWDSRLRE